MRTFSLLWLGGRVARRGAEGEGGGGGKSQRSLSTATGIHAAAGAGKVVQSSRKQECRRTPL